MNEILKRPIIIIFTGHVGSSWLASLLGNHRFVKQLGFEPIDDFVLDNVNSAPIIEDVIQGKVISQFPDAVRSVLSKSYERTAEDKIYREKPDYDWSKTRFVVFKTRVYLKEQRSLFIDLLPRVNPTIIFLCRRNKIKNAISQFKRTQLNISHLDKFHEIDKKRKPVEVDPSYILEQALNFVRRELVAKSYVECLRQLTTSPCFEIFYEDLLSPEWRTRFFDNFFYELGLENDAIESNYLKMTPDNLQYAVANYSELSNVLRNTVFQPYLQDDNYNIVDEIYTRKLNFPGINAEAIISNVQSMFEATQNV